MLADRIRRNENFVYIILWSIVLLFYVLNFSAEQLSRSHSVFSSKLFIEGAGVFLPLIFVFVINNYLLLPRLLMRDKIAKYVVAAIVLVAITFIAQYLIHNALRPGHFFPFDDLLESETFTHRPPKPGFISMPLINCIIYSFMVIGLNIAVSMMANYMTTRLEKEHLATVNTQSQLNHLKDQINPHFYLNMLNNIHGLIDLDPEKAKDMVYDMSQLMRYMLYDSNKELILLSAEVTFLNDYIRVMSQRYPASKVSVNCDLPAVADTESIQIPPLLFLVFIENAFKHGIDYRSKSFIDISLKIEDNTLRFKCINSKHNYSNTDPCRDGGIGLQNIRTRLDIIYGNDTSLDITETESTYSVTLTLPITQHK